MARIIILIIAITASGCAGSLKFVGDAVDRMDRCQSHGQANYDYPSYCGGGTYAQRQNVYTTRTGAIAGYGSTWAYPTR